MKYSDKLKDPRWQKKRLEILQRDDFSCRKCGDKSSTLHIHHKYYTKDVEPWDYKDDCFITLCETCHLTIEIFKKYGAHIDDINILKFIGFNSPVFFVKYKGKISIFNIEDGEPNILVNIPDNDLQLVSDFFNKKDESVS